MEITKAQKAWTADLKVRSVFRAQRHPYAADAHIVAGKPALGSKFQDVDGVRSVQNTIGARLLRHCHKLEVEAFAGISA